MPDIWVLLPIIVSAAVIALLYTIPPPWVKRYMKSLDGLDLQAITAPQALGSALRHAYPPEDVAGMVNAVVEAQRPAVMDFIVEEGIPFLAAAGGADVAENARMGRAVKELGGGAGGIQAIVAALGKPGKKSGVGDLMQYLPVLQQFMGGMQAKQPDNGPQQARLPPQQGNYHVGGKLGGA